MTVIDDPVVKDAAESALAALLVDRDVHEVSSLEGAFLEVVRRGKRERLDAVLEGPLFALLRESGAEAAVIEMRLRGGHRLVAGPLADGRVAMRVEKTPSIDVTLEVLMEEGLLPPGLGDELRAAVLDGAGLAVVGPARVARQRVAIATARALAAHHTIAALTEGAPAAFAPLNARAQLEHRVEAAAALGADLLVGIELSARDVAAVARFRPALPLLASVAAPSSEALTAALDAAGIPVAAVFGNVVVIGFGPDGSPRLAEWHGPSRVGDAPAAPALATNAPADEPREDRSDIAARPPPARAATAPIRGLGDVYAPDKPPGSWASDAPDVDPGWELADAGPPPAPGSFDAVLQSHKSRPTFSPRPPREHPQARKLKGAADPFGGLTFEPPPGGQADDANENGDEDGADPPDEEQPP